jgi:hypothetical protein
MTILDGAASLTIYSETQSASAITVALQLTPTFLGEVGEPRAPLRIGSGGSPAKQFFYKSATWDLTIDADEARPFARDDDTAGFASLQLLVDRLARKAEALQALRTDYRTIISWYGTSGSHQGGFILPAPLLLALGQLGCDVYGNIYSFADDGDA